MRCSRPTAATRCAGCWSTSALRRRSAPWPSAGTSPGCSIRARCRTARSTSAPASARRPSFASAASCARSRTRATGGRSTSSGAAMLTDRTRLHIAIQQSGKNSLTARVENFPAELMFVRDDDIPTFVSDGACEFGIVGQNVLDEFALGQSEPGYEVLAELGFGRCSLKIAAPEATPYDGPQSLAGQRIATSYPHILGRFLERNG